MYAMLIARYKMFPEVKEKGMAAVPRLIAFTSEHVCVYVLLRSYQRAQLNEERPEMPFLWMSSFQETYLERMRGKLS